MQYCAVGRRERKELRRNPARPRAGVAGAGNCAEIGGLKFKSALRKPQSARKAALPQNCLTAEKIVPLFRRFVNTSRVINQLINRGRW